MATDPTSYTHALNPDQAARLRTLLESRDFEFVSKPYTLYAAKGPQLNVSVYEKGPKVLLQGKGTGDFVRFYLEPEILGVAELGYEEVNHPDWFEPHLGIDESGKGDFFGPLVIAGAYVDAEITRQLLDLGAVDSKKIGTDARIRQLAAAIRKVPGIGYEIITIRPRRYNELYPKFRNLNRMLAWGHAKVIENLLERRPDCPRALSDQFANPREIERALGERGRGIEMQQRTKAESDPAVAAASILAREAFVDWLERSGEELGVALPKGAAGHVVKAATAIARDGGEKALGRVGKLHFKTARDALAKS